MKAHNHATLTRTSFTRGLLSLLSATLLCAPLAAQPYGRPGPEGYDLTEGMSEEELEAYHTRRARQLAREYEQARDAGHSLPGVGPRGPVLVPAPGMYARGQQRRASPLVPYGTRPVPAPVPVDPNAAPAPEWVDPYEQLEREQRQARRERLRDEPALEREREREPQHGFFGRLRERPSPAPRPRHRSTPQEQPAQPDRETRLTRQTPQPRVEGDSQPATPQRQSSPTEVASTSSTPEPPSEAGSPEKPRSADQENSGAFNLGNMLGPPTAERVPESEGMVYSPFAEGGDKKVDVRGLPSGTEVKDPYTGKTFIVP